MISGRGLHFPASSRYRNYLTQKPERDSSSFSPFPASWKAEDMWGRWFGRLLRSEGSGGRWVSAPRGRFSPALRRGEKRHRITYACVLCRKTVPVVRACSGEREARVPRLPAHSGSWRPCSRASPRGIEAGGSRTEKRTAFLFGGLASEGLASRLAPPLEPRQASF
ncbi:hypothetical protein J1605_001484 [Eschrichtius robustus]|uniref:Uncharacterized protein n=1 Tax=Eschrichtius robustus TaxID=9764 RepID=A0AB34I459_ESCRO|nr:hypothetical protein J1605_001484 [Eschrichtius robustus]